LDDGENRFLLPIMIPVKVSPRLRFSLCLVTIGSCTALWVSHVPVLIMLVPGLLIAAYVIYLSGYPGSDSPRALLLKADDSWSVIGKDGSRSIVTLGKWRYVHSLLVILQLKYEDRQQFVMLTADTVNKDTFRRLRVRLRHCVNRT